MVSRARALLWLEEQGTGSSVARAFQHGDAAGEARRDEWWDGLAMKSISSISDASLFHNEKTSSVIKICVPEMPIRRISVHSVLASFNPLWICVRKRQHHEKQSADYITHIPATKYTERKPYWWTVEVLYLYFPWAVPNLQLRIVMISNMRY